MISFVHLEHKENWARVGVYREENTVQGMDWVSLFNCQTLDFEPAAMLEHERAG
jgi:hypothetical protein